MRCATCGKDHPADEIELSFRRPDDTATLSDEERSQFVKENSDLSVLREERFFVRALLPLPVASRRRPYSIGLWVEVSQATFERIRALWKEPTQADEPSFEARIANDLPFTSSTLGMPARLQLTGPTTRPEVIVLPASNVIYQEQSNGITAHRANEYSAYAAPEV